MTTIGVDLDNTLVCYDDVFREEALARGLAPEAVASAKGSLRDHLRAQGREDAWTELQGHVYGPAMSRAKPFPGALEFLRRCKERGLRVYVISHRTLKPFKGPEHDLHAAARAWLASAGLLGPDTGLMRDHVFLETTKEDKLRRIDRMHCDDFIDDLPEFLNEPAFPAPTRRWLFGQAPDASGLPRLATWERAAAAFFPEAPAGAAALLKRWGAADGVLRSLPGAANNRVYLVETGARRLVLKHYFRSAGDPRDRLAAEWAFSRFAWDAGLRQIPEPLLSDPAAGLALYGCLEGGKPRPGSVGPRDVEQALEFLRQLNGRRDLAAGLPDASEACFSIERHLELVERRAALAASIEDEQARPVVEELARLWPEVKSAALQQARGEDLDLRAELPQADRVVSPSDFGFHNSIRAASGKLQFLDFEYAGWDDPAKLVCDFFCQQAVPAPADALPSFVAGAARLVADGDALRRRVEVLRPVYELKWACILVNGFLGAGEERRAFAGAAVDKAAQLAKAKRLLGRLAAA